MNKFYVKFAPWNEKTLSSIANKTIKFSTVYEFNDFNEYRYVGCPTTNDVLKSKITDLSFLNNLLTLSADRCTSEYHTKIIDSIKQGRTKELLNDQSCLPLLNENLAYSSVGIFCLADIDVFKDDSAQLMFAHYAGDLTGVALIYEVDNTPPEKIIYNNSNIKTSDNTALPNWCKDIYKDMNNFLCKSEKWNYEKERRVFGKPGIVLAKNHNLTLKAILYTRRFHGEKEVLSNINNHLYNQNLIIERIFASSTEPIFTMEKDKSRTIDFFKKIFIDIPKPLRFLIRQAALPDIHQIAILSKAKRLEYEKARPQFWRYAGEEGDKAQEKWFKQLLEDKNYVILTAESDTLEILGFIIGKLMPAPEVYNPGGLTLVIDDFCVESEELWESVGAQLVEAIKKKGKAKGAAQILVVCGAHDAPKRKFLMNQNLSIASEWFVGGIV